MLLTRFIPLARSDEYKLVVPILLRWEAFQRGRLPRRLRVPTPDPDSMVRFCRLGHISKPTMLRKGSAFLKWRRRLDLPWKTWHDSYS